MKSKSVIIQMKAVDECIVVVAYYAVHNGSNSLNSAIKMLNCDHSVVLKLLISVFFSIYSAFTKFFY